MGLVLNASIKCNSTDLLKEKAFLIHKFETNTLNGEVIHQHLSPIFHPIHLQITSFPIKI